jgi:hypothetical protein
MLNAVSGFARQPKFAESVSWITRSDEQTHLRFRLNCQYFLFVYASGILIHPVIVTYILFLSLISLLAGVPHNQEHESVTGDQVIRHILILSGLVRGERKITLSKHLSTFNILNIPQNIFVFLAKFFSHD